VRTEESLILIPNLYWVYVLFEDSLDAMQLEYENESIENEMENRTMSADANK